MDVGVRDIERFKERITHLFVVVLACVDKQGLDRRVCFVGFHQRSDLDEVWACAHDIQDLHDAIFPFATSVSSNERYLSASFPR